MRGKPKYLVRWKGYMMEEDTWERLENLDNIMELMEEFEKEIREEEIRRVQMRKQKEKEKVLNSEAKIFKRSELLEKYIMKILFGWDNGNFEDECYDSVLQGLSKEATLVLSNTRKLDRVPSTE